MASKCDHTPNWVLGLTAPTLPWQSNRDPRPSSRYRGEGPDPLQAMAQGLSAPQRLRGSDLPLQGARQLADGPADAVSSRMSNRPRSQAGSPMTLGQRRGAARRWRQNERL